MAKNNNQSTGKAMNEAQFTQMLADGVAKDSQQAAYPNHYKAPNPVIARAQQYAQQPLSPQAMAHFARPAVHCELCGSPMMFDNPDVEAWERKWSIHRACGEAVQNQLDRRTGITSERS